MPSRSPPSCAEVAASPAVDLRRPTRRLERLGEKARRCITLTWDGALEPPCHRPTPRQSAGAAPHVASPRTAGASEPPCMPPSPAPDSPPLRPPCLAHRRSSMPTFARWPVSEGERERARAIQIACMKRRGREERKKEREKNRRKGRKIKLGKEKRKRKHK
jgi:hypothetical protein